VPGPNNRLRAIAVDGKTLRGSATPTTDQRHLLAALDHRTGVVVGQIEVNGKTNEIPMLPILCDWLTDTLHCQRSTIEHLVVARAHDVLTAKNNQPTLRAQLAACPDQTFPSPHRTGSPGARPRRATPPQGMTVSIGIVAPSNVRWSPVTYAILVPAALAADRYGHDKPTASSVNGV
jgi:hypothetical protein